MDNLYQQLYCSMLLYLRSLDSPWKARHNSQQILLQSPVDLVTNQPSQCIFLELSRSLWQLLQPVPSLKH
jgi:hypothetical protein